MAGTVRDFTALIGADGWSTRGAPTVVTFSFDVAPSAALQGDPIAATFEPFTASQVAAARDALAQWDAASGIVVVEVPPGQGDIRFGNVDMGSIPGFDTVLGFAFDPQRDVLGTSSRDDEIGGDVFIDSRFKYDDFYLMAHEIGHALGLDHPFENTILAPDLDNAVYTVMSYDRGPGVDALGPLDRDAIEFLYGPQAFTPSTTGGIQQFGVDAGRMATFQAWGGASSEILGTSLSDHVVGGAGNDVIAGFKGADRLEGGTGTDTLIGGAGDDFLFGGPGFDVVNGEAGFDTAYFEAFGERTDVTYQPGSSSVYVLGAPFAETVRDVEQIAFVDGLLTSGSGAVVARLYETAFGRDADRGGLAGWTAALEAGATLQQVTGQFMTSAEFQARYGAPSDVAFVTLLYRNALGRDPDAAGLQGWVSTLGAGTSRAEVVIGFSESAEHVRLTASADAPGMVWVGDADVEALARLYLGALARLPDEGGLAGWLGAVRAGTAVSQVADAFAGSFEFTSRYGALSNDAFVEQMYANVLGRGSDAAGKAAWTGALDSGQLDRGDVLFGFSDSLEFRDLTDARWNDGVDLLT